MKNKINKECKFKRFCNNKSCKYLHPMSNYLCDNLFFKDCNKDCKYYHLGDILKNKVPIELINIINEYLKPKILTKNYIDSITSSELPFYLKLKKNKKYFMVRDRFMWFDVDAECIICNKEISAWSNDKEFLCKNNIYCEDKWCELLQYYYNNKFFTKLKKNYFTSKYCNCEDIRYNCLYCYEQYFMENIFYIKKNFFNI